jgi:hypothetical protein
MRQAAREHALTMSWDAVFEGVYAGYEAVLPAKLIGRPSDSTTTKLSS